VVCGKEPAANRFRDAVFIGTCACSPDARGFRLERCPPTKTAVFEFLYDTLLEKSRL